MYPRTSTFLRGELTFVAILSRYESEDDCLSVTPERITDKLCLLN
jgi:hypothetical protein